MTEFEKEEERKELLERMLEVRHKIDELADTGVDVFHQTVIIAAIGSNRKRGMTEDEIVKVVSWAGDVLTGAGMLSMLFAGKLRVSVEFGEVIFCEPED